MTEVFINNERIDLDNGDVSQTFQLNDIADISSRQTSFTNKFKVPRTQKNIKIFKNLGIFGKTTEYLNNEFPYGKPIAKVIESGIELVSKGCAVISQTNPLNYEIVVYGSEKTFFEKIKDLTLQDCYPTTPFTYTAENVADAVTNTDNFIFSILFYNNYTKSSNSLGLLNSTSTFIPYTELWTERMTPQFFWKYLFESIFAHLGYEVINPIENDSKFKTLLTNASKSVVSFNVQYGQTFDLKNVAPNMLASDFIKEVMMRFGLMIKVDELTRKVTFVKFDDVLKNSTPEDWSGKFDSVKKEFYKYGNYSKKNKLNHPEDNSGILHTKEDELSGDFLINNESLESEGIFFTSKFKKPKLCVDTNNTGYLFQQSQATLQFGYFVTGIDTNSNSDYIRYYDLIDLMEYEYEGSTVTEDTSTIKKVIESFEPYIFYKYISYYEHKLIFKRQDGTFYERIYASLPLAQYKEYFLEFDGWFSAGNITDNKKISFQNFIDDNYQNVIKTLNKMHAFNVLMNLSVVDIYQLDFFRRKYIKQLGGFFYLNKVLNFKNGKLTECEFIKTPPDVQ